MYVILIVLTVLLECKTDKQNSQCEHGQPMEQTRSLFSHATQVWLAVKHQCHIWRMNVRSELPGQVSLAAFDQIFGVHEAMNGYKNLKIH